MEKGSLHLNKIFDWYKADFKKPDLRGWLRDYVPIDSKAEIKFMEYDWSLNKVN
jgi:hypothetical protein